MVMKQIFKLALIFFFMWIGVKSLGDFIKGEDTKIGLLIDVILFIVFLGSPATSYWGELMDKIFNSVEETNEENNDEIN